MRVLELKELYLIFSEFSNCLGLTKKFYLYFRDDEVDKDQRPGHRYRRRWIKRKRNAKAYKKSHENCLAYLESLEDRGWEVKDIFSLKTWQYHHN